MICTTSITRQKIAGMILALLLTVASLAPARVSAQTYETELLTNGGFETGTFEGWERFEQQGSTGTFRIDDALGIPGDPTPKTPGESFDTVGPHTGAFYAVTDSNAPGTDGPSAYALVQSFTIPLLVQSAQLQFALFVNDQFGFGALNPQGTLDYTQSTPTQLGRVDLLVANSSPFTTNAADVLAIFYLGVGSPSPPDPYMVISQDLTGLVQGGQTYQLRFATVQNQFSLNMGVDDVSVHVTAILAAPEPAPAFLLSIGLLSLLARRKPRPHTPSYERKNER